MRRRLFYKEDETTTPLPWTMLLVLTTLCILNDVNVTMLFSFAPKLIKTTFGYSEIEAGYYTGILSSVFYIGILLCSFFWSYLGDTLNKKCSIIISSIGHTLATLAFGFSNQYYFACVARFLQGCFFGVIYMSKSMLYNHLDDSNMTHGMTILTASGVIGYILGPSFAGFLVYPYQQYPSLFAHVQLFKMFPILLPYIVLVFVFIVFIVLSFVYLPNNDHGTKYALLQQTDMDGTNESHEDNQQSEAVNNIRQNECEIKYIPPQQKSGLTNEESKANGLNANFVKTINEESTDFIEAKLDQPQKAIEMLAPTQNDDKQEPKAVSPNLMQIVRNSDSLISCTLYGVYGLASIGSNELFPLYASTSKHYRGLGLTTSQIGTILLSGCIVLLFIQVPLIRRITNYLKARKTFIYAALIQGVLTLFIPAVGTIPYKECLFPIMGVYMLLLRFWVSVSFLSVTILINNSTSVELNATANSFAFTLSAIGRLCSPSFFGAVYSWSLTNVKNTNTHALGFPFDQNFSFFLLSLVLFLIGYLATKLSSKVDYKNECF